MKSHKIVKLNRPSYFFQHHAIFFFTDLHSLILWLSRALYLLRVSYKKRFITIYLFLKLDLSAIQPLNPCHPHGSAQLKPGEPWLFQINLVYCMGMLIDIRRMPRSRGSKLNTSAFSWWSQSPFEKRESLLQFFFDRFTKRFRTQKRSDSYKKRSRRLLRWGNEPTGLVYRPRETLIKRILISSEY